MNAIVTASSVSFALLVAIGCSSSSSPSDGSGSTPQNGASSGASSSGGGGTSSGGASSSSGGASSSGASGSGGASSSSGAVAGDGGAGDAAAAGTCGSSATADACGTCCEGLHPAGAQIANDAWDTCACDTPGVCATACATTYCSADGGAGPQPGDACDKCLQGASQCDTVSNQACSGNADCQVFQACITAAGCDSKP